MSKAEEFWNKTSANYDKSEERFEYIHNKTGRKAENHLKNTDIVLDFGCGTGTKSCELANRVEEIHAIDISSEMIDIAKSKATSKNINNVNFQQTTLFDERYQEGSFDVVLAFNMLHTVDNPLKVIKRIHELLKHDGLFISSTPCLADKKSLLVSLQMYLVTILSKIGVIPIAIRRYKSAHIDELITTESFQLVESDQIYKGASSYFIVVKKQ